MAQKEFAVIYRWSVDPEHEAFSHQRWRAGTLRLKIEFGALGSCLTRAENGDFIAFARWPSEVARGRAFAAIHPVDPWPGIRNCDETKLWAEEDHLTGE